MGILKDKTFLKIASLAATLILIYIFLSNSLDMFRISRIKMNDVLLKTALKLKPSSQYKDKIVIIAIDDQSFAVLQQRWPWPRRIQAALLNKLKEYSPRVVVLDIGFLGESQNQEDDILLAEQLKQLNSCVLAAHFSPQGKYILPLKTIRDSATIGFTNKLRDKDNFVRSARAVVLTKEKEVIDYSFEIKLVSEFLNLKSIEYNEKKVSLKDKSNTLDIPISDIGSILINYSTKKEDFKTIPFWRALKEGLPLDTFKDKIVIVGATTEALHDIYPTPLGIMPGVCIAANTAQTILERNFVATAPLWMQRIFILLIGLIVTFFTYRYSLPRAFFLNTFFLLAMFLGYVYLFRFNILADFSSILIVGTAAFLGTSGFSYLRLAIEANILKGQAITDALTGLYGFRYFDLRLKNETERARRYGQPLSLMILDIDHFKQINDTYGHDNGNIILKKIAAILKKESRKTDVVARFGGEEFCIILPQIRKSNALAFAERIRQDVEKTPFVIRGNKAINITISIGIAYLDKKIMNNSEDFLKAADSALYNAKDSGRNRVCVFRKSTLKNL